MIAANISWFVLSIAVGVLLASATRVAATEGQIGACQDQRLHTFTVSNDTNGTTVTYTNTGTSEPTVTTFENSLPSPSLCGADYERCNALVTSNADETIRVVMFPLDSGIGLVSFDYSTFNDSLVYRDQFLLLRNEPNCTFVYFVEELIGYCLDLNSPKIRAFLINIDFVDLTASTIQRRDNAYEVKDLLNVASLSNLVYFTRHGFDECFTNEGNHVLFLDEGDLLDHSFTDGQISFNDISIDSTCSRLHRVGDMCRLAAHCNSKVVLFDTQVHVEQTSFTVAEYGQTFFCPTEDFVGFERKTLSLHHKNGQRFENSVSFPFGEIRQGDCLNMADKFFFVANIDDGRTLLVDFSGMSYRHLGESDLSTVVPAKVRGHFAIVNNGNETNLYNLGLPCMPEPLVIPNNFIFVTSFPSRTMEQYRCIEPAPGPVTSSIITMMTTSPSEPSASIISPTLSSLFALTVSGSPSISSLPTTSEPWLSGMAPTVSLSSAPTPTNELVSSQTNSSLSEGVIGGVLVVAVIAVVLLSLMIVLMVVYVRKWSNKQHSGNMELQKIEPKNLNDNKTSKQNVDLSSSESDETQKQEGSSKEILDNESQEMLLEDNLRQSTDSLGTEVREKDPKQEDIGTDSGSADTSASVFHPQPNQLNRTLVLNNPVRQEVGDGTATEALSSPVGEGDSQLVMFEAEVHQDVNVEVSLESESATTNLVPMFSTSLSPRHLAELDSSELHVPQPFADTCGESSQLLVPSMRPDLPLRSNPENRHSPLTDTRDNDESCCTECPPPMQDTSCSQARLVAPDAPYSYFNPADVRDTCQQNEDRMNSVQYRQIGGGTMWTEEPNNDRHLNGDVDIGRQISTDSEESRG